jgi:hypothetical protein
MLYTAGKWGTRRGQRRIGIDQTAACSLTIVVGRARDDKGTHIALSYWKRI